MSRDSDDDPIIELIAAGFLVALGAGLVYRVVRAIAGYSAGERITQSEAQQLPAGEEDEAVGCHECGTTEGLHQCYECRKQACSEHKVGAFCSEVCYDEDRRRND